MGVAVELLLDPESTRTIAGWRDILKANGIQGVVPESEFRPHLTLSYSTQTSETEVARLAEELAADAELSSCPIEFGSMLVFCGAGRDRHVLGLSITPTQRILSLHERCFDQVARSLPPIGEYCHPGRWNAHCSIADRLSLDELPRALGLLADKVELPLRARAHGILIELESGRCIRQELAARPIPVEAPSGNLLPPRAG